MEKGKIGIIFLIAILFIILAFDVSALVVHYISNSVTTTATVSSQCNDGLDNDPVNMDGIDLLDSHCSSACDPTEGISDGDWSCV